MRNIDSYSSARVSTGIENDNVAPDTIDAAIRYMSENMEHEVKLEDLSEYVGLNPTYFSHLFKEKVGHSPMAHLRQLPMSRACNLLDFTKLHVNQICHKVGISDSY